MYPPYWTTSKEGLFMRYSNEFKKKCVDLYRQGKYPKTPDNISTKRFRDKVREWVRIEEACGPEALNHKTHSKRWNPEEKLELVNRVIAGESYTSVAISVGINDGALYQWVRRYKLYGYIGLCGKPGRKPKEKQVKKENRPSELTESEREELIRLRAKCAFYEAENAVIKKEIALREEQEKARLKAKKQRSSKNSEKKDIH